MADGGGVETGDLSFVKGLEWRFVEKLGAIHIRVLGLELDSNKRPPFSFALCDYERRKAEGAVWYSSPFQTSPYGFVFYLKLVLNGDRAAHASLSVHRTNSVPHGYRIKWERFEGKFLLSFLGGGVASCPAPPTLFSELLVSMAGSSLREVVYSDADGRNGETVWISHQELEGGFVMHDCLCFTLEIVRSSGSVS